MHVATVALLVVPVLLIVVLAAMRAGWLVRALARAQEARRQAEAAHAQLLASEERFRLTFEDAPIGMALVELDGRFARVNRALCEITGYTADELHRLRFQDITPPEDIELDRELSAQIARNEIRQYQIQKRYIRKDGSSVHILLSVSLLHGGDGRAASFIAQIEDITERKRAEHEQHALAEAGAILVSSLDHRQTLHELAELVVRELADWCLVELAPEPGGLLRRISVACADPRDAPIAHQAEHLALDPARPNLARRAWQTRRPVLVEHITPEELVSYAQSAEHLDLLQRVRPCSMIALPLVIRDELVGMLLLLSTTRAFGPSDLWFATRLAQRATLALENGRLYESAVRATQIRDQVLGIVAHDLRNPLAAIHMHAEALREDLDKPACRSSRLQHAILRAARRMSRMIDDLLDVTLLDSGRLELERTRVAVAVLLADAADAQHSLAAAAALELLVASPPSLAEVAGDPDRLMQAFENLIGNAVKFTPAGGRITLGAAPAGDAVRFWVSDTGRGIPADELPHVFDRFWRVGDRTQRGAGLGLAITRGIVEAHGGRIWVESQPGRGTTFHFTIPHAAAPRSRPDAKPLPSASRSP